MRSSTPNPSATVRVLASSTSQPVFSPPSSSPTTSLLFIASPWWCPQPLSLTPYSSQARAQIRQQYTFSLATTANTIHEHGRQCTITGLACYATSCRPRTGTTHSVQTFVRANQGSLVVPTTVFNVPHICPLYEPSSSSTHFSGLRCMMMTTTVTVSISATTSIRVNGHLP